MVSEKAGAAKRGMVAKAAKRNFFIILLITSPFFGTGYMRGFPKISTMVIWATNLRGGTAGLGGARHMLQTKPKVLGAMNAFL